MNKIKGVNNKLDESLRKVGLFVYELENSEGDVVSGSLLNI